MGLTQEVASYVAKTRFRDLPSEVVGLARGFILDGLGVALAGSTDECARIVQHIFAKWAAARKPWCSERAYPLPCRRLL
jgi:2-methylcitrate dehydratase PrpD